MKTKTASVKQLKNTPGPWRIARKPNCVIAGEDNFVAIAQGGVGVAEANAKLIAAAPELLEAVEFVFSKLYDPTEPGAEMKLYSGSLHPTDDNKTVRVYLYELLSKVKGGC